MEQGIIALLLMIGRLAFFFWGEQKKKDDKKKEAVKDALKAHKEQNKQALINALDRLGNLNARVR